MLGMSCMKSFDLLILGACSVLTLSTRLERRKNFVETHQEHGHLPGGDQNPGPGALMAQMSRILLGENPLSILGEYNQKADAEREGGHSHNEPQNQGQQNMPQNAVAPLSGAAFPPPPGPPLGPPGGFYPPPPPPMYGPPPPPPPMYGPPPPPMYGPPPPPPMYGPPPPPPYYPPPY